MKVLVCGGRDFKDADRIYETLDKVLQKYGDDLIIITGSEPKGADNIAEKWAKSREVDYIGFPAKWKKQGRPAGPIRNKRMRDELKPDACVAFKGGIGTLGMCKLMEEIGVTPWKVDW